MFSILIHWDCGRVYTCTACEVAGPLSRRAVTHPSVDDYWLFTFDSLWHFWLYCHIECTVALSRCPVFVRIQRGLLAVLFIFLEVFVLGVIVGGRPVVHRFLEILLMTSLCSSTLFYLAFIRCSGFHQLQ